MLERIKFQKHRLTLFRTLTTPSYPKKAKAKTLNHNIPHVPSVPCHLGHSIAGIRVFACELTGFD